MSGKKKRPARVFYDEKKDRFYIKSGSKRVYFPKGATKSNVMKQAIKIMVNPEPKYKISPDPVNEQAPFKSNSLIMSYINAQNKAVEQNLLNYQKNKMYNERDELKRQLESEAQRNAEARAQKEYQDKYNNFTKTHIESVEQLKKGYQIIEGNTIEFLKNKAQSKSKISEKNVEDFITTTDTLRKSIGIPSIKEEKKDDGGTTAGKGKLKKQVYRDGLYSDQIIKMMSPYKKNGFLGVISADEIDLLIKPSLKKNKFGFIMNLDTSDQPGSHWVALYIDLVDNCEINYYDSFAEEPSELFLQEIKKLIDAHDLDYYLKMKINRIKQQAENSALCGFHAIRFLIDRFEGKPFIEASRFSEVRQSEKKAQGMLNKYDKFGYI
ncbi:MAG: Ulp1 family isopeptidase [Candidatus Pacearchaeota archaeon]